ncbi:hypothetical protein [Actinomadura sp. 9N215]|uniref:hypothetical protein n=1 Tax=Actinomadura sp. 9N215 TaxID=3375150 RepID=UPI0037951FA0
MQTSRKPRANGQAGSVSRLRPPGPGVPDRHKSLPSARTVKAARTSVVWSELWAVAVTLLLGMARLTQLRPLTRKRLR